MTSPNDGQGFVSGAGEGPSFEGLGNTWVFKALGGQTGGKLEAFELGVPPGGQLPPHVHRQFDESIYVLEGELTILVGERTVDVDAGSFVYIPRNVVHRIENTGTSSAKILLSEAPAPGVDQLLRELSEMPAGPPDMEALGQALLRYDIELVADS